MRFLLAASRRTVLLLAGLALLAGPVRGQAPDAPRFQVIVSASNPVTELEGPEAAASAALDQPTLRLFSKGEPVRRLQALLNQTSGAALSPDGDFGPRTQSAVMAFQAGEGLAPDGIVGVKTWTQLLSVSP